MYNKINLIIQIRFFFNKKNNTFPKELSINTKKNRNMIYLRLRKEKGKIKKRLIDFHSNWFGLASVIAIKVDPNRSSWIALIYRFSDKSTAYILAPYNLKIGYILEYNFLFLKNKKILGIGNRSLINNFSYGTLIHNLKLNYQFHSFWIRSAGNSIQYITYLKNKNLFLYKSGLILLSKKVIGSIGGLSNSNWEREIFYKAGQKKKLGFKSKVRGKKKNPTDHLNGGSSLKGKLWKSKFGWLVKSKRKTSKSKKIF